MRYDGLNDYEIVSYVSENNEVANEVIFEKYRPLIYDRATKLYSYCKNCGADINDLVQEGMIGLLAAVKSYNPEKGAKFATYASICINNSVQTALKKFSRLKAIPQENLVALEEDVLDSTFVISAEDEYLAKESVSTLTEILYEGLSKFENEVLRLHIMGCSYSEIAEKLGKNPKAIDNAIQRIRKKLNGVAF